MYLATWKRNTPAAIPQTKNAELLLKIIYSGLAKQTYGKDVHKYLANLDMAPLYFVDFRLEFDDLPLGKVPLETYHIMEYLPPPSGSVSGWITLHKLIHEHPEVAARSKDEISDALEAITSKLQQASYVHGDLRTNNVLVCVTTTVGPKGKGTCVVQPRPNTSPQVAYLKVVDFDWAGIAEQVRYPHQRNPEIHWPGQDGHPISISHDREMIHRWLSLWPSNADKPIQKPLKKMQVIFGEIGSSTIGSSTKKPLSCVKAFFGD